MTHIDRIQNIIARKEEADSVSDIEASIRLEKEIQTAEDAIPPTDNFMSGCKIDDESTPENIIFNAVAHRLDDKMNFVGRFDVETTVYIKNGIYVGMTTTGGLPDEQMEIQNILRSCLFNA